MQIIRFCPITPGKRPKPYGRRASTLLNESPLLCCGMVCGMAESFEDIADTFAFLDEWEDRYRYVIELGKAMPDMDESLQVNATRVHGCASQVWIAPEIKGQGAEQTVHFTGTSDAMIVRGLIAILHALYSGKSPASIMAIDASAEMADLGLDQHLSSQRSNGLRAMVARIREIAERCLNAA